MSNGVSELYRLRRDFTVIGLTGRKGAGCSEVGQILSKKALTELNIRQPNFFKCQSNEDLNFGRKYKICYDYAFKNWTVYKTIKYRDVVLLHFFRMSNDEISKELKLHFSNNVSLLNELMTLIDNNDFIKRLQKIGAINHDFKNFKDLYDLYFEDGFTNFSEKFIETIDKYNTFCRSRFLHRIANNLRGTGYSLTIENKKQYSINNIYTVAETINRLIKTWKDRNRTVHIVIDALRNSLEIMFFKERYSAFYMMSINSDFRRENLTKKISDRFKSMRLDEIKSEVEEILKLDDVEYKCNDFKEGRFWAPDVQNCIQKCDIHLINNKREFIDNNDGRKNGCDCNSFSTIDEQLIKFTSLIMQPGLITPTAQERCMQIAFNAKSNSGCISRQVGAVITDSNYSVKSVGWNDIPSGAVPCNLRDLSQLIKEGDENNDRSAFSPFELGEFENDKKSKGFRAYIKQKYQNLFPINLEGKICSFCFKTLYNEYEGDSNQVYTRSLHAEENAMLQISKYGGQGLENGILFTTASPCELCSKKSYQLGIRKIYYIDPYPGISERHILMAGKEIKQPQMVLFSGAVGSAFHKLYEPFLSYKDEITLMTDIKPKSKVLMLIEQLQKLKDDIKLSKIDDNERIRLNSILNDIKKQL